MDYYEMEESISSELVDRLSELPLGLILYILSFLPMRDVVATTFLSKRWKNLWTIVPCLNFDLYYMGYSDINQNFMDRVLMLWKGEKILKFGIEVEPHFFKSSASDMDSWLKFAVENKVEELNVDLNYFIQETFWLDAESVLMSYKEDVYWAPQCLYSCLSIRKLRLVGFNLGNHGSPSWNRLKSLSIDGYCFSESTINLIMSGSPRLEVFELKLMESEENLTIMSTSLKKLKVKKYLYTDEDHPSCNTVLRICCPNLETLEILGALYSRCLFTDVSSLTDATIWFYDSHCLGTWLGEGDKLLEVMVGQILSSFQHVEKVALSFWCVKVFGRSRKKHLLSPLLNVKFLKLEVCCIELGDMMDLLRIFPNLKKLVIGYLGFPKPLDNYMEFEANLSKSFLLQLRTVEITSSIFDSSKMWFFEFLLKWASMLEMLVIRVKDIDSHQHERLCEVKEKLQSMARSFPTAKVIFNGT